MWYKSSPDTWQSRMAIAVIDTGGSAGSYDVEFTLGEQHAHFWANVQSDGYDILIAQADGANLIDHQRAAWNYANKTATIQIDNASLSRAIGKARIHMLWIYYNTENEIGSDPASSFTASSPLDANVWPGKVRGALTIPPSLPGDTQPRMIQQKTPTDEAQIILDLQHFLDRADTLINNSDRYDEVGWVECGGEQATTPTNLFDNSAARFDVTGRYFRGVLQGGSTATDYTQWARVGVANPDEPVNGSSEPIRVYDQRFILKVKSVLET